jgi:hypothetical protein
MQAPEYLEVRIVCRGNRYLRAQIEKETGVAVFARVFLLLFPTLMGTRHQAEAEGYGGCNPKPVGDNKTIVASNGATPEFCAGFATETTGHTGLEAESDIADTVGKKLITQTEHRMVFITHAEWIGALGHIAAGQRSDKTKHGAIRFFCVCRPVVGCGNCRRDGEQPRREKRRKQQDLTPTTARPTD